MTFPEVCNFVEYPEAESYSLRRKSTDLIESKSVLSKNITESEENRAFNLAESALISIQGKSLNNLQRAIFQGAWQGQTYEEIASEINCSEGHIKDVAADLWKQVSEKLGQKVYKKNFKAILEQRLSTGELALCKSNQIPCNYLNNRKKYWGEIPDISGFYGRDEELSTLTGWINKDQCRLLTVLGIGGVGKTTLIAKLAKQVQNQFEFIIWRSLHKAPAFEDTMTILLNFFTYPKIADSPTSVEEKILLLLEFFRSHRCLVIFDNLESILEPGEQVGCYKEEYSGYGELIRYIGMIQHQSCLVLTSREKPRDLELQEGENLPVRSFYLKGLPLKEIQKILLAISPFSATESDWNFLVRYYAGNPLMLKILATQTKELFECNISKFLQVGEYKISEIRDLRNLLSRQFERLSTLEKQIMYQIALDEAPIDIKSLQEKTCLSSSASKFMEALRSLLQRSLIEKTPAGLKQEPVIMDYVNMKQV